VKGPAWLCGIRSRSAIVFTASRNFSVTCPSTTGEGIGLPSCSLMNVTNPPDVARGPMYPFRYSRSRHSTSNVTCPSSSSGMLAMPSILCPNRYRVLGVFYENAGLCQEKCVESMPYCRSLAADQREARDQGKNGDS
jgi:hypothetical protein